jgi:hypothetical protein
MRPYAPGPASSDPPEEWDGIDRPCSDTVSPRARTCKYCGIRTRGAHSWRNGIAVHVRNECWICARVHE